MFHYKTGRERDPVEAAEGFRRVWGDWVEQSYRRHEDALVHDGVDQALFTCGWMPWLQARPEHEAWAWLKRFRDDMRDHFSSSGRWRHGYWTMEVVDTGMAHYTRFLKGLWKMDPVDGETVAQILDAAEHINREVSAITPWFNPETGLLRSVHLGTRGAAEEARFPCNIPGHLRTVELALLAFRVSGESSFLDFAQVYGGRWADAVLSSRGLPVALGREGGLTTLRRDLQDRYRHLIGHHALAGSEVARAEAVLASGGVDVFLELWQHTRDNRFVEAVERLLDCLVGELVDVDAGALVAAIRAYRNRTGRTRYDDEILQVAEYLCPYLIESQSLDVDTRPRHTPAGVGKHRDMPGWRENCQLRQHNPILLGLAAEITHNDRLAACAIALARGYLVLAMKAFPDGHLDAGSSRSVSAILCGHARENGAGMLTGVLLPLEDAFCRERVTKPRRRSTPPFAMRLTR